MLWFLVLHIVALLFWGGCLLYLPALIVSTGPRATIFDDQPDPFDSIPRFVFTRIATPAALLAIIAGTLVFLIDLSVNIWLIAKLTLVTVLVIVHSLLGLLIMRAEANNAKPLRIWCRLLGLCAGLLLAGILWLVLAKPAIPVPA